MYPVVNLPWCVNAWHFGVLVWALVAERGFEFLLHVELLSDVEAWTGGGSFCSLEGACACEAGAWKLREEDFKKI